MKEGQVSSIFVGIAGGSCSGKTTLVSNLQNKLNFFVATLAFDSYYCDQGHLPFDKRALVNYDHPDSLDVDLFIENLRSLRNDFTISSPVYNFATHTRSNNTSEVTPAEVMLIDGILLLSFPEICDLLDISIFVSAPEHVRLERRIIRDVAERGRTSQQAKAQFLKTVQPMHEQFVEPSKQNADLIISGEGDIDEMTRKIEHMIFSFSSDAI